MRQHRRSQRCPLCDSTRTIALPSPGARSMRSDGLVDPQPLAKCNCLDCGSVFRAVRTPFKRPASSDHYTLNAGADTSFDAARHAGYAQVILGAVDRAPASVLDVGCGNGALLEQLRDSWSQARLHGVEPAHLPRSQAARRGLDVQPAIDGRVCADLVVSVNVIEHTTSPAAFLAEIGRAVRPGGTCIVIWPDDRQPSSELLFNDHLFTLSARAVEALAARAGLVDARPLDAPGGFQGLCLRRRPLPVAAGARSKAAQPGRHALVLARQRKAYLREWAGLGPVLQRRLDPGRTLVGFGVGEAAHLLRAYAPDLWSRIDSLCVDGAAADRALGLPLLRPQDLDPQRHQVLLATHPKWHAPLQRRFDEAGVPCVAWNDLVEG